MTKSIIALIGLLLIAGCLSLSRSAQSDTSHDRWLQDRYLEATSIKEGMTRADLIKIFGIDGGLQAFLPTRYVLKSSNLIKVDVEFELPQGSTGRILPEDLRHEMEFPAFDSQGKPVSRESYQYVPNEKLKIKSISKPYIEPSHYD